MTRRAALRRSRHCGFAALTKQRPPKQDRHRKRAGLTSCYTLGASAAPGFTTPSPILESPRTADRLAALQRRAKHFHAHASLFDQPAQRSRLDRLVHRHHHRPALFAQNNVRAGLPPFLLPEAAQRPHRFYTAHIARQFHATAKTGSSTKCNLTRSGARPSSK